MSRTIDIVTDEHCPACGAVVAEDDIDCQACGEPLDEYVEGDEGEEYDDEADGDGWEVIADTARGDSQDDVYGGNRTADRWREAGLLAAVLVIAALLIAALGLVAGWWSGDDETATDGDPGVADSGAGDESGSAGANDPVPVVPDGSDPEATSPPPVLRDPPLLGELSGFSIVIRDAAGLRTVDLDTATTERLESRAPALATDSSFVVVGDEVVYVADATVWRVGVSGGEPAAVVDGDWVGAVEGSSGEIWVVDTVVTDVAVDATLLLVDLEAGLIGSRELAPDLVYVGAVEDGIIATIPSVGDSFVVGLDGDRLLAGAPVVGLGRDLAVALTCASTEECALEPVVLSADPASDVVLPAPIASDDRAFSFPAAPLSPDGRSVPLLFADSGGVIETRLVSLVDGTEQVVDAPFGWDDVAFTPDGRWVIWIAGEEVVAQSVEGGDVRVLAQVDQGLGVGSELAVTATPTV